jgi:hypothetical protein
MSLRLQWISIAVILLIQVVQDTGELDIGMSTSLLVPALFRLQASEGLSASH